MKATLYIYAANGFASDLVSTNSATSGLAAKRGDHLALSVVFHDGTRAMELPADAAGSFMVKARKGFAGAAVLQAASWTKQAGAEDGYLFTLPVSGGTLDGLLGMAEALPLICEVSWMTGGVRTTTPTAPFTVLNNLSR